MDMKQITKIALLMLTMTLPLLAQNVATLTALKGAVSIENSSSKIEAVLGASLQEQDSVITADKSKAQLIFKDETIVTVGKNSNFSIAKYIYDDKQKPQVEFGLLRGAITTITGKIGKIAPEKFKVKTKTATIGIRGTNFTVVVFESGIQQVYCTYGAIDITIGATRYPVEQGHYLELSTSQAVQIKAFSAKELSKMKAGEFGKSSALKGGKIEDALKESSAAILDTTIEKIDVAMSVQKEDVVQDAVQSESNEKDKEPYEPYQPYEPIVSEYITMSGVSSDSYYSSSVESKVNLQFLEDGSRFDSENSWVEVLNKANANSYGEYDNWKFTLASTPYSYMSRDEFSIGFVSVELTPIDSSSSKNAELTEGLFRATSDLSADDYMSWGVWNTSVTYDVTLYGEPSKETQEFKGLWVAGEATLPSVVEAFTGSASYEGKYQAYSLQSSEFVVEEGVANLFIDFGAKSGSLSINQSVNENSSQSQSVVNGSYQYGMSLEGNALSGSAIDYENSYADGLFYGKEGTSVGGKFNISDTSNQTEAKGVYQVTKVNP